MSGALGMERLCIHTITTKPWPVETAIEKYAAAGVAGITLWTDAVEGRDPKLVARAASDAGLSIVSLVRGGFFAAAEEEKRLTAVEHNRELIDLAAQLGAPSLVLVCGAEPSIPLAESREQIAEGISRLARHAEERGVRLSIEPLHPMYAATRSAVNTMEEANLICRQIGSPALGIAVDIYHLWWDPHLEEEIIEAGREKRLFALPYLRLEVSP